MAGLDPAIHVFLCDAIQVVDDRPKGSHDEDGMVKRTDDKRYI